MCKKFEGINFGPHIFGQQRWNFFANFQMFYTNFVVKDDIFTFWYN